MKRTVIITCLIAFGIVMAGAAQTMLHQRSRAKSVGTPAVFAVK